MKVIRLLSIVAGFAALAAPPAFAAWPDEPVTITMLIGNAPGGGADIAARTLAPFVQKYLGANATIVPVNRPGAGGAVMFNDVASAKPDGRTIGVNSLPNLPARIVEDPNTRFNVDSFTYLGNFNVSPGSFVVATNSPYKNMKEILDYARANPGKFSVAVGGIGNDDHLNVLRLARINGVDLHIIPFGGEAEARNAVMAGNVDMGTMSPLVAMNFRDSLRILALTSPERVDFAPDVPTLREQGIDIVAQASKGFIAPAGLPDEITQAFATALQSALKDPDFIAAAKKQSLIIEYWDPEKYKADVKDETAVLADLFKAYPWK